jgi:Tfp pilus assembly protein PilV
MARLTRTTQHRLIASSILEVVVSMVIIVMVLGISLMIYTNVMRQSLSARKLKAQFVLQEAMIGAEAETIDKTQIIEGWEVRQDTYPYEAESDLIVMHLTAFDEDHNQIAEIRKVILLEDHE